MLERRLHLKFRRWSKSRQVFLDPSRFFTFFFPPWDARGPLVEVVFPPSGNSVLVISSFSIPLYSMAAFFFHNRHISLTELLSLSMTLPFLFFPSSFAIVYFFSASMAHSSSFFQEILAMLLSCTVFCFFHFFYDCLCMGHAYLLYVTM